MSNAFRVDPADLRGATASVEACSRQIESGRKSDAAGQVSSGLAGFAVVDACESAGKTSVAAFSGVAKSWRAWSDAAADGAKRYEQVEAINESVIRRTGSDVVA